ncbi:MAG: hypothetical protein U5R49_06555 [Deltaproteobacteria bacterium]|nr:hypothetical protein [Deltaproteobacteria bacterium]
MVFDLLTPVVGKLFETCIDQWHNKQSFKNIRLAVRDRLRREARLNSELLNKIKGKAGIIDELSTKALQDVFEMPIPVGKMLDRSLDQDVKAILEKNKNYKRWTENIQNETQLIERLWQRTRMLEIRVKKQVGSPNVNYVCVLNRALAVALEAEEEKTK